MTSGYRSSAVSSRRNGTGSAVTGASSSSAYRRPVQTAAAIVAGAQASPIACTQEMPACAHSGSRASGDYARYSGDGPHIYRSADADCRGILLVGYPPA